MGTKKGKDKKKTQGKRKKDIKRVERRQAARRGTSCDK